MNGNLIRKTPKDTTKEAFAYAYSSKNQLIQVRVFATPLGAVTKQIDYVYDVAGRRIQKSVIDFAHQTDPKKSYTRRFVYDGDNIFLEFDGANGVLARHTHSPLKPDDILMTEVSELGAIKGVARHSGSYFYLKDLVGSVAAVADLAGTLVQKYQYSSFGELTDLHDALGADVRSNPVLRPQFTFTGRELDEESGLYYYRARYYQADIGRFIQKDPHPGRIGQPETVINSYTYVQNMPTYMIDPTGKIAWFVIAFAVSFLINFATAMQSEASVGQALLSGLIGGAAGVIAPIAAAWALPVLGAMGAGFFGGAVAGAFNGGLHAWAFNGNMTEQVLLGAGFGAVGAAVQITGASYFYDRGLTSAASNLMGQGAGYIGGLWNTGLEFPKGENSMQYVPSR